eukprot:15469879-Alexandrium_andersonii.AAC.1
MHSPVVISPSTCSAFIIDNAYKSVSECQFYRSRKSSSSLFKSSMHAATCKSVVLASKLQVTMKAAFQHEST